MNSFTSVSCVESRIGLALEFECLAGGTLGGEWDHDLIAGCPLQRIALHRRSRQRGHNAVGLLQCVAAKAGT